MYPHNTGCREAGGYGSGWRAVSVGCWLPVGEEGGDQVTAAQRQLQVLTHLPQ